MKRPGLILGLLSLIISSCSMPQAQENIISKTAPVIVKTSPIIKESGKRVKSYYGELKFSQSARFVAQQSGVLTKLNAVPGQLVHKGDIIAVYPPLHHKLQIEQARIEQEKLSLDYHRQQELYKAGAVSKVTVEDLKAQLDIQDKTIQQLERINIITAPFTGIITEVHTRIGEEIHMEMPVFSMAQTGRMEVDFYVSQQDITQINIGSTSFCSLNGTTIEGEIIKKAIQLDAERKAFRVTASFHSDAFHYAGNIIDITVEMGDTAEWLSIPVEAFKTEGKKHYAFVVENDKAIRKEIQIARRTESHIQLSGGLLADEQLITAGLEKIEHNSLVNIQNQDTSR